MTRSRRLEAAAGALLGLVLLGALLHRASPAEVGEQLLAASRPWIAVVLALHAAALTVRVARWRGLLTAADSLQGAGWRQIADAAFIGWLANALLPARAGELARPAVHARATGASFAAVLGTLVVERAADLLVLCAGLWTVLVLLPAPAGIPDGAVQAARAGAVAAPLGVLALAGATRFGLRLGDRLTGVLDRFRQGFAGLHSGHAAGRLLASSVLIWCIEAACVAATLAAFDLPGGWPAAIAVVGCVTVAIGVITTPAGLGVEQGVSVVVLGAWGAAEPAALAASFVLTATALFWVVLGGAWALTRQGTGLMRASTPPAE